MYRPIDLRVPRLTFEFIYPAKVPFTEDDDNHDQAPLGHPIVRVARIVADSDFENSAAEDGQLGVAAPRSVGLANRRNPAQRARIYDRDLISEGAAPLSPIW